jgi:hypothetical protein
MDNKNAKRARCNLEKARTWGTDNAMFTKPKIRPLVPAAFVTIQFLSVFTKGESLMARQQEFVSHAIVRAALSQDEEACQEIDKSRQTLPDFVRAFERRAVRQVDFIVTVMCREVAHLIPVGILLERVAGDTIYGRRIPNELVVDAQEAVMCRADQVIDWRYEDVFELEGGQLYRLLFHRQPWAGQLAIGEKQSFLIDWYDKNAVGDPIVKDVEFRDLFRDIANLRHVEVERKLRANKSLHQKEGYVPVASEGAAIRSRLGPRTVSRTAAELGDAKMIQLLDRLDILRNDSEGEGLLGWAAASGNLESCRAMLELGFDVNTPDDEYQYTPLSLAAARNYGNVVALLLEHGADCNRRDYRGTTALFDVRSVVVAQQLLAAGARVEVLDNEGRSCVQRHLERGRIDIVNLLVEHGAKRDPEWELGLTEEQVRARGAEFLHTRLRDIDPNAADKYELGQSINYGCVLPIKRIPIPQSR